MFKEIASSLTGFQGANATIGFTCPAATEQVGGFGPPGFPRRPTNAGYPLVLTEEPREGVRTQSRRREQRAGLGRRGRGWVAARGGGRRPARGTPGDLKRDRESARSGLAPAELSLPRRLRLVLGDGTRPRCLSGRVGGTHRSLGPEPRRGPQRSGEPHTSGGEARPPRKPLPAAPGDPAAALAAAISGRRRWRRARRAVGGVSVAWRPCGEARARTGGGEGAPGVSRRPGRGRGRDRGGRRGPPTRPDPATRGSGLSPSINSYLSPSEKWSRKAQARKRRSRSPSPGRHSG